MRQFNISSDLVLQKPLEPIVYKQFDNGDHLKVEIYQDGDKINLTNEIVLAFFQLKDGTVIQKTCSIENGNAIAKLDNNILSQSGALKAEFTVFRNGQETTTRTIQITVESSINRNDAVESVPQWDIIDQVLDIAASDGQSIAQKIDVLNSAVEDKYEELSSAKQIDSEVILARGGQPTLGKRLEHVDTKLAETDEKYADVTTQLAEKANEEDLEIERARISNLTANAGDTDGNSELLDIRVGFDGVTYPTAGEATRALNNYMATENQYWSVE